MHMLGHFVVVGAYVSLYFPPFQVNKSSEVQLLNTNHVLCDRSLTIEGLRTACLKT